MSLFETTFVLFLLLLLNAFFSTAEFSIASSRKLKLEQLSSEGNQKAQKVIELSANPTRFITVIQISLNIIAILSGILGDQSFSLYISKFLTDWSVSKNIADILATIMTVLMITSVFIVFAELIPKRMAFSDPERVATLIINPLLFFLMLFKPFVILLSSIAEIILKFFNVSTHRDDAVTFEDMSAMINQGAKSGILEEKEHHLIENVLSLTDRKVISAMTYKDDVIFLDLNYSPEEIKLRFLSHPHSRFLVCDGQIDNLIGFIEATNILKNLLSDQSLGFDREKLQAQGLKTILTIPDSLSLLDVLDKFRESRQDISAVVNEFGSVVGIITINDILSTLMGNVVSPVSEVELIVKRAENSWLIDGKAAIEDVKKLFGWTDMPHQENYETISGFLMFKMKCIPKKAQTTEFRNIKFEIVDVEKYRIDEVMATIIEGKNETTS